MDGKVSSNAVPVANVPNSDRISRLNKQFFVEFKCNPSFYVKVPGRVNIIGEHIDYCGYPVLPMALEQDILIAARVLNEPKIHIQNIDTKYGKYDLPITNNFGELEIKPDTNGKPFWYNYVLCGIKGALEFFNKEKINGVQFLIDGNIPPASGLSSSSALVSAACLAFMYAQNEIPNKTEIASLCAKSERYVGTQGGGMDQAIAFLAEKYSAKYITFKPLNALPVALPEDAVFVVAHSLAEMNKAATNDFNRRVIECRLAAKIIGVLEGISLDNKIVTLSEVQINLSKSLEEMILLVKKHLPNEIYTKQDICKILRINEQDMDNLYLTPNTKTLQEFKLKQRALHVYEEAKRVEDFRNACSQCRENENGFVNTSNGDVTQNGKNSNKTLNILGQLMSASHESLKTLYECSHDNLDRIVDISKELDVHCRLTGAGWGGCIVALCPKDKAEKYIDTLIEKFYVDYCQLNRSKAKQYIFVTTPNHGAMIYTN
ncbi:N-acetylgalactosamine kinase [Achroia grisella]|uniref:N-acetylgalactosamine kinase n=1 Tax=Achroia grisella TaxID=688607 RepID=UPI0027D31DAF|nr:N-acetylgalactosamine kinase [Achroia grisella]